MISSWVCEKSKFSPNQSTVSNSVFYLLGIRGASLFFLLIILFHI